MYKCIILKSHIARDNVMEKAVVSAFDIDSKRELYFT
jgi:hypothetical protein